METKDCEWKGYDAPFNSTERSDPFSNIVTHHAEDGSGIGSAIIAGEFYTSIRAESILTTDPSDDEEEEGGRTVPKLLIEQTHFPPKVTRHPLPQHLCVESMPISISDICIETVEPRLRGSHARPSTASSLAFPDPPRRYSGQIGQIYSSILHLTISSL